MEHNKAANRQYASSYFLCQMLQNGADTINKLMEHNTTRHKLVWTPLTNPPEMEHDITQHKMVWTP